MSIDLFYLIARIHVPCVLDAEEEHLFHWYDLVSEGAGRKKEDGEELAFLVNKNIASLTQ